MTCGCIIPTDHADLAALVNAAVPITYTGLNNTVENGSGGLVRSGGTPNTSDAYGYSSNWCEGTDCGYWEVRQFFDDPECNETIFYVIEDEFGNNNRYGWFFQNGIADFRRSPYHGTTSDFPIYYGPAGGDPPPDQVGYNVGFRFGIYYNNGTVRLYENVQFTNDTNDFIDPVSYTYAGLPTDRRWRLKIYVFPEALSAHSNEVVEAFSTPSDACGAGEFTLPAIEFSASGTVVTSSLGGTTTQRFDAGLGNSWYLIPQISDSGDNLRDKQVKAARVTGKVTDANFKMYRYGATDPIVMDDLTDGTNSITGPVALTDTANVTQSQRFQLNVPNSALHTIRVEGTWDGEGIKDRIDEIEYEVSEQGIRR